MMRYRSRYFSYMLRLWETRDGDKRVWRASLESPGSGKRRGFADLESLLGFLEAQTTQAAAQAQEDSGEDEPR